MPMQTVPYTPGLIVDVPSVTVMATPRNSMAEVTVTSDKDERCCGQRC